MWGSENIFLSLYTFLNWLFFSELYITSVITMSKNVYNCHRYAFQQINRKHQTEKPQASTQFLSWMNLRCAAHSF